MSNNSSENGDGRSAVIASPFDVKQAVLSDLRAPVHVVYGGAHLFRTDTVQKLGRLALDSLNNYAPNFVEFAQAMHIRGAETLPFDSESINALEERLATDADSAKEDNKAAWLAWQVYRRTRQKLEVEPVEDYRIDFEDGYGIRSDDEEDLHAALAASELGNSLNDGTCSAFTGLRIKSLAPETADRALRTLNIFVKSLFETMHDSSTAAISVTLPKITSPDHVRRLAKRLRKLEKSAHLKKGTFGIEVMIERPESLQDDKGRTVVRKIVEAAGGRCKSAHFGAYDYTASLGISGRDQSIRHPACEMARHLMLLSLAPIGIRLSDSVTPRIPAPVHRGAELTPQQVRENQHAVHTAWQEHFANILYSMSNGFYQSWDLHPGQLAARFGAVNFFFLDRLDEQARRMRSYVENSAQATLTGVSFDDAASIRGLAAFFARGVSCGALTEAEVGSATGLAISDIAGFFDREKSAARVQRRSE